MMHTGFDLLNILSILAMHSSVLAPVLALALAASQLVWQQELACMELMQQQHLDALRTLALHSMARLEPMLELAWESSHVK